MYLIGFFSKRQKFHIVEQRDTMEEVEAYLNNHDYGHFNKLVVFQLVNRPTKRASDRRSVAQKRYRPNQNLKVVGRAGSANRWLFSPRLKGSF